MASLREVKESPLRQGTDERIAYVFDYENIGTPSTDVSSTDSFQLYDVTSSADVTATKMTGTGGVVGYNVTSPLVISLVAGYQYKLTSKVVVGDNTVSAYALITGE